MENNKIKKSVKFQGDTLNFYGFIQVFVFTTNHHLKSLTSFSLSKVITDRQVVGLLVVGWLVVLLFYVHGKHLRSCWDGQLT